MNASGEKSLRNGPTSDNILSLEVVLADGSVSTVGAKDIAEVTDTREKALIALHTKYAPALTQARGDVTKAASGYRLEKIIEGNIFDVVPLFVGAQGTLGIITKATLQLVPIPEHVSLLIISAQTLHDIPKILSIIARHNPEGLETFDIHTFEQAEKHLPEHATRFAKLIDPQSHLFILAQFSEDTLESTNAQASTCYQELKASGFFATYAEDPADVDAAWHIRRHSFLLMRDYNEPGYRAIPCIEDVIVPLDNLSTFAAASISRKYAPASTSAVLLLESITIDFM